MCVAYFWRWRILEASFHRCKQTSTLLNVWWCFQNIVLKFLFHRKGEWKNFVWFWRKRPVWPYLRTFLSAHHSKLIKLQILIYCIFTKLSRMENALTLAFWPVLLVIRMLSFHWTRNGYTQWKWFLWSLSLKDESCDYDFIDGLFQTCLLLDDPCGQKKHLDF